MAENGVQKTAFAYQKGDAVLIPALASGMSVKEAAALSSLSERTVTRRLSDSSFRAEVQRVQIELADKVIGALSDGAVEGAKKLKELLSAQSENVQLGAARALVDFGLKLREQAELERLKEEVEALKILSQAGQGGR